MVIVWWVHFDSISHLSRWQANNSDILNGQDSWVFSVSEVGWGWIISALVPGSFTLFPARKHQLPKDKLLWLDTALPLRCSTTYFVLSLCEMSEILDTWHLHCLLWRLLHDEGHLCEGLCYQIDMTRFTLHQQTLLYGRGNARVVYG